MTQTQPPLDYNDATQPDGRVEHPLEPVAFRHVARVVLATFVLTFIASRVMVVLIMAGKVPDFYFHMGRTHVHHLNYGIFTLSGVGAYLLFRRPSGGRPLLWAAIAYGVGLGLTFDEFGMWVHLGGSYWQRASFDAVVVVAAALGLVAYAPSPSKYQPVHYAWTLLIAALVGCFVLVLAVSVSPYAKRLGPWLHYIEATGPQ
jgi:hypothetical protein